MKEITELAEDARFLHDSLRKKILREIGIASPVNRYAMLAMGQAWETRSMGLPAAVPIYSLFSATGFQMDISGIGNTPIL